VRVTAVDPRYKPIRRVCIEQNRKVMVEDFVDVVEEGFRRHGIATAVYDPPVPAECGFRSDLHGPQGLGHGAVHEVRRATSARWSTDDRSATYKHRGGFGFNKWASTESKMRPVIDELLAAY